MHERPRGASPRDTTPDLQDGWRRWHERLILASALLASVVLASSLVGRLGPPDVVPSSAPAEAFSAARARVHLERVARVPHPTGSAAAREVESYIAESLRALGLQVQSLQAPACTEAAGLRRCGNVRNVLGTLPGRTRDPALLLSAHYDSVPNAPGAGDDGAAVAALLETARALAAAGEPERDVVFAFLDGEEELLLGAAAFCRAAGGVGRIGLVANFDARGNRGAVTLIGASPGSAALVGGLLGSLTHPVVNSFYPSVASVLPNATDAEIYERCGFPALSFAFADGFESYHQATDTPERLDDRSLQHHGSYALDVARRFASRGSTLPELRGGGIVFFDVAGVWVVRYSFALARSFGAALLIAAGAMLWRRVRSRELALATLAGAAGWGVASLLAAAAIGAAVVSLTSAGWRPWADYAHAARLTACAAGFVAGALALLVACGVRHGRGDAARFGPLLLWLGLAGLTSALAPGLSHLFTWPAAALLVATCLRRGAGGALARGLASLLAVMLLTPVTYALVVVVGAPGVAGVMACLVLVLGIWAEPFGALFARPGSSAARWFAALSFAAGALGSIAANRAVLERPGPPVGNSLGYALDAEARRARWVSADASMDAYKRQLLGDQPERKQLAAFASERPLFIQDAPLVELEPPRLELVSDGWGHEGERTLRVRVHSPRAARAVVVWEVTGVGFSRWRFEGAEPIALVRFSPELDQRLFRLLSGYDDGGVWSVRMFAPGAAGALLELSTKHAGPLTLRCADRSEGLAYQPRGLSARSPEWTEGYPGDHTIVSGPVLRIAALPPAALLAVP